MGKTTSTLDAALAYAGRGWHVLPVKARDKIPGSPHGKDDATTDPARIRAWFFKTPATNVGIATGKVSGIVVLDVDAVKSGLETLARLESEHGRLPNTLTAITGGGGRHFFFAHPGRKVGNRAGIAPGLDVRGDGGYVVAAPSVHKSGKTYSWVDPNAPIAELPDWLLTLMVGENREAKSKEPASPLGYGPYIERAISGELDKLARAVEGSRNDQLNRSAFALGRFIGAGAVDRAVVEQCLTATARAVGLADHEIRSTLRSGIEKGMREPRTLPGNGNGNHQPAETRKQEDGTGADVHIQSAQYAVRNGRICRWKQKREGDVTMDLLIPLCNFTAQITEEVAHDDGADVTRLLTIEGEHADGVRLPPARVDAAQFGGMRWVAPSWGMRPVVEAGPSTQDHLRAAIQYLSTNVAQRHVYTHTGWRGVDGKTVFLTQAGALGGSPIAVELDKELERYRLPPAPEDPLGAMEASLNFLSIAPLRVTIPLWSAMYLAPLTPIIPPKFMLWVYGVTGTLKSTLTALALSHYGEWTEDDLILWSATANALEKYLFLAKDVPFVIDDYAPQTDRYAAQKLEETASRLVRGVGNRSGRARMKGDLSLRTVYRPRGLVISTGEQLPDTQSLVARLVTVETAKGDIHLGKLSEAQDERDRYPHAMAGYIAWLAAQWAHFSAVLPDSWRELRTRARREGQHLRLPESLASLYQSKK